MAYNQKAMLTTITQDFDDPNEAAIEPSTPRVLLLLASALERMVTRNVQLLDQTAAPNGFHQGVNLKVFDGVRAPNISIPKYLERLYKYTECSPSCFVVAYIYIDRLVHKHPQMMLLHHNVHRLVLTTLVVASKILDDVQYNNAFYAKVGGVSNVELNRLELELLFLLDFQVMVSSHVFESYCWYLEKDDVKTTSSPNNTNRIIQDVLQFDLNLINDIDAT